MPTATVIIIICPANFVIVLLSPSMSLAAAISIPTNPATPTNPLANSFQLKDDNFFKAPANINTATDIPIIADIAFVTPFNLISILLNMNKDPSNSPKRTVIAVNDLDMSSALIVDNTKIAAANMPIATAIFLRVSAFKLF